MNPTTTPPRPSQSVVGPRVSAALRRSGKTVEDLATELHMSRQALGDRITGRTRYTADELPAIAHVLGLTLAELVGDPCPRCGGLNGSHGLIHRRYGNGAGGNVTCPEVSE